MCNINMKGATAAGRVREGEGGGSGGECNRMASRSNRNSSYTNNGSGSFSSSNRSDNRSRRKSNSYSTSISPPAAALSGDNSGATMYEINTCSARDCNPDSKSCSTVSASVPVGDESVAAVTRVEILATTTTTEEEEDEEEGSSTATEERRNNNQDKDEGQENLLEKPETDEQEIILLDIPHLQRFLHRVFNSSPGSEEKASRGTTKKRTAKSSSTREMRDRKCRVSSATTTEERCDENLNGFYVVLVIVTFVCYLNGLNGDFVHDDIPAITMNKDVVALNPAISLFKNDFWGTAMSDASSHKSYRPLTTVSFRLNYLLFGLRPQLFHLTNIILHAIVCILFTRICFCVAGLERQFALIAGLIFATHPIHSEAVTGIVGRADVLACLFFLLSLLLYHGHSSHPTIRKFWLSIACGGLSMLAKETGITVLMVNAAYDTYRMWPHLRQLYTDVRWSVATRHFVTRLAFSLLFIVIFCAARIAIGGSLPQFSQQDNPAAYHPSLVTRLLTFSYLAAFNWWLVICPTTLSHDWQMSSIPLISTWTDPRNLLTVLILVVLIGLVVRSLGDFKEHRHGRSSLLLGLLMLTVPFLPASNIIVTVGFVVAERVLYIPSLGSILLTVYGIQLLWQRRRRRRALGHRPPLLFGKGDTSGTTNAISPSTGSSSSSSTTQLLRSLVLLLCTFNGLKTVHRNEDWMSRESLLSAGLKVLPHNAKMHYNFGNFLRDTSQIPLAMHHYHIALELWPTYSSAHNNLGTLVRDVRQAEFHFLEAIRYSEGHLNAHFNLGQLYKRTNRTVLASQMLEKCIQMDPKFIPGYIELFKLKRGKDAEALLREMAEIAPKDQAILFMFGQWLMMHDYHLKAFNVFVKAFSVDNFHRAGFLSYLNAAKMLRHMGRSRLLQFVLRFHLLQQQREPRKKGYQPNIYLREWAIKTELKYRARIYDPQGEENSEGNAESKEHKSVENRESTPIDQNEMETEQKNRSEREKEENGEPRKFLDQRDIGLTAGVAASEDGAGVLEEIEGNEESKSSLVNFSNQMDQKMFRLKFHLNHRTCNITKWLYPLVKENRRLLLGPVPSQYTLEQLIMQNTQQMHEKSARDQRCISSILRHLRMTRKLHQNYVVPYLMANLWDNL